MQTPTHPLPSTTPKRAGARGPVRLFLDLFSSVRLGITLLVILFVYSTIGSAGIVLPTRGEPSFRLLGIPLRHEMLRQWRPFELSEFEWFHTPVFNGLIAAICLNLIITTLRRIPLTVLSVGVWMIHWGIVILAIGSVIYFSTKVEGDTPVFRRQVVIEAPGAVGGRVSLPAIPGAGGEVETSSGRYRFRVVQVEPKWPLLSEGTEGASVYSVSVMVTAPDGREFVRQLLDGHPDLTEDLLPGRDGGRVKKLPEFEGRALVDEQLRLALAYEPQSYFWLRDTSALYVREAGARQWAQRPIRGLPRYNDYLSSRDDASAVGSRAVPVDPIHIDVPPVQEGDPIADADVRITGFLRFAREQAVLVPGGELLNPVIDLRFSTPGGTTQDVRLLAFDPRQRTAADGAIEFQWVDDPAKLAALEAGSTRRVRFVIPAANDGAGAEAEVEITPEEAVREDNPFREIPSAKGYSFRVTGEAHDLALPSGGTVSLLFLEIRTPEKTIVRWVADDPGATRDLVTDGAEEAGDPAHQGMTAPDPEVQTTYTPPSAPVLIVAGPGEIGVQALIAQREGGTRIERLRQHQPVAITEGLMMSMTDFMERARVETRPVIVPPESRDKDSDAERFFAMAQVEIEFPRGSGRVQRAWLPFSKYSFDDPLLAAGELGRYEPVVFPLGDGREIEVLFSRERRLLPAPVVLDEFILSEHVGGFEPGRALTVRDWTSVLRFAVARDAESDRTTWSEPKIVSTNSPAEFGGLWYFQAFWDPPAPQSGAGRASDAGLNYTGLGVGNRNGVLIQLAGCCISVAGMIYAFYVKPIIRRRRIEKVHAGVESAHARAAAAQIEVEEARAAHAGAGVEKV